MTCQIDMTGQQCRYLLLLTQRFESVRQTSSHYHTTLQPYRSPASSSTRQHHEREAVYLRCIGAYNPSPRIVRAGGADANTPTTPHQPLSTTMRKKATTTLSPHGVVLSVVRAAACNSVIIIRACCHRLPIYVPDHHHGASLLFGQRYRDCFWYVCYRSHSKLCVTDVLHTTWHVCTTTV